MRTSKRSQLSCGEGYIASPTAASRLVSPDKECLYSTAHPASWRCQPLLQDLMLDITCGNLRGKTSELMPNFLTHLMKITLCKFCYSALHQVKENNPSSTSTETIHRYMSKSHWPSLAKKNPQIEMPKLKKKVLKFSNWKAWLFFSVK